MKKTSFIIQPIKGEALAANEDPLHQKQPSSSENNK
jgi:hypothetical protein